MYDRRKITIFVLAIIGIIFLFKAMLSLVIKGKTIDEVSVPVLTAAESKALKKYPNGYHLEVGQIKGIPKAFKSKNEMLQNKSKYIWEYDLAEIKDNRYYEVPKLTHSLPYLKEEARDFLDDLGKEFEQSLSELDIRPYRFSVTSIMRTLEDQKGLRKTNVNATPNTSSHYYGRTIDLSQTRFFERGKSEPIYSYRLRNLLLRDLIEMQEQGRCYVLLESQTKCIHITIR
ncbi:MAG: hypothetical protein A2W95_17910 [Bacteroidetes bacterium GWA2_40_14]|nr:MAG: hypothetical protein A2W95_17910 [Bacteroidetes bacterium GWA2_40_14]OFZ26504.1 MAG: hypothetical protein A2437_07385 [Bacteroidetes bacterium RIFOXYC2_FULL_40_12]HBY52342.1 hypothetical protein [Marinilabiliales bacterium]